VVDGGSRLVKSVTVAKIVLETFARSLESTSFRGRGTLSCAPSPHNSATGRSQFSAPLYHTTDPNNVAPSPPRGTRGGSRSCPRRQPDGPWQGAKPQLCPGSRTRGKHVVCPVGSRFLSLTTEPNTQPATPALRLRGGLGNVDAEQVLKYAQGAVALNGAYCVLAPEKGAEVLARDRRWQRNAIVTHQRAQTRPSHDCVS
jgi:hypothetical protein